MVDSNEWHCVDYECHDVSSVRCRSPPRARRSRDRIESETETQFRLPETWRSLGVAKHWAQFPFQSSRRVRRRSIVDWTVFHRPGSPGGQYHQSEGSKDEVSQVAMSLAQWQRIRQTPMRLYLTKDFHEAALAFKEQRRLASR